MKKICESNNNLNKENQAIGNESVKAKRTRTPKYLTVADSLNALRKSKRDWYDRNKVLNKVRIDLSIDTGGFDKAYQRGIFLGIKDIDFQVMVTVTNHDTVTLKKHDNNVTRLLEWLEKRGFIADSFKANEHEGGNYHSHILLNLLVSSRRIAGVIKRYWEEKYGYVDVLRIDSQGMKERVIKYCLKQLTPTHRSNRRQELVDTWELRDPSKPMAGMSIRPAGNALLNRIGEQKRMRTSTLRQQVIFDIPALNQVKPGVRKGPGKKIILQSEPLGIY